MTKKHLGNNDTTMATVAKAVLAISILGGLLMTYQTSNSEASVIPPGGDTIQQLYVNNVTGSDDMGDGTEAKPFATIQKGITIADGSYAPSVRVNVFGTKVPYQLTESISPVRDGLELVNYGKRPFVVAKSPTNSLIRLEIKDTVGTSIIGFDFQDIGLFVQSAGTVLIKQNRFMVNTPQMFQQSNNSAVINVASYNGDPRSNLNLVLDGNHVWIPKPTTVRLSAIRLDGAYVSQVYDNLFTPNSTSAIRAVLEVVSGEDIKTSGNRFDRSYNGGAVYLMSEAKDAQVFDYKPVY